MKKMRKESKRFRSRAEARAKAQHFMSLGLPREIVQKVNRLQQQAA
jgi:hypothetical protein